MTLTSAGFEDWLEHALVASNSPRIVKLAIVVTASFFWSDPDEDETVVPEIMLWVACCVDSWSPDFLVVVMLSPPLRLAQSALIKQESGQ